MLITCFLLCFSLYLFSSAFQVFSVIPLCIYAHFFNCLVKLFAELIECLCFKTLVSLVCWKFLSAQYEHYVFWLCVFVCRPWRCMGISMDFFFSKKCHWYCFYTTLNRAVRFSRLSCFSWSIFCTDPMYTLCVTRWKMYSSFLWYDSVFATNLRLLVFTQVFWSTVYCIPHFVRFWTFFWVMMDLTVNLPTPSTLLLMLFSNVFEILCFKLLVFWTLFGV